MTRTRRYLSLLTLLVFAAGTLVPFFAVYKAPASAEAAQMAALFGEKVLLCTPDGFRLVDWRDIDKNGHEPTSDYQCALCYVAAHGTGVEPPVAVLSQDGFFAEAAPLPSVESLPADLGWRKSRTRAPPVSFVA